MSAMSDLHVRILEEIEAKNLKVGDKIVIDGYEHVVTEEDISQTWCDSYDVARDPNSAF